MRKTEWLLCPVCGRKRTVEYLAASYGVFDPCGSRQISVHTQRALSTAAWLVAHGNKIREDTELKNFPLYCPKCKQETVVDFEQFIVSVCKDKAK